MLSNTQVNPGLNHNGDVKITVGREMSTGYRLDCLLINPPFKFKVDSVWRGQRSEDPPLPLMALAAYIRTKNFTTKILDCDLVTPDIDEEFEAYFVAEFVNAGIEIGTFGLTTTTLTIYSSFKIARICKKYYPDSVMVFGGAHASFIPDESMDDENVDIVVIGEGETTLEEILEGRDLNDIEGIVFKQKSPNGDKEVIKTGLRKRNKALDELPMPAYDLIDFKRYRPILGSFKRLPAMMMVSSRGCPWDCSFCRRPVGNMLVVRSAQNIFEEIKYLSEEYGVKDIMFMDDTFTVVKKNVLNLCELLIESKLDVRWLCFARVDVVDVELLQKMKKAGCWQIMYGVENFNHGVLENIQKGIDVDQVFEAVSWTKKAGIECRICMMVGNPGDTEEIINENIRLVKKLDPDLLVVNILTPFPGHDIFNWAKSKDLITSYNWDDYYGAQPLMKLDTLTPEDIKRLYVKMITSFYFRPKYIFKKLIGIRSVLEVKLLMAGFLGIVGFAMERVRRMFVAKKEKLVEPEFEDLKEKALRLTTPTARTAIS